MFAALKILAYVVVALACARAAHREKNDAPPFSPAAYFATARSCLNAIHQRGRGAPPRAWRAMGWLFVATVCLALALARAIDIDALIHTRAAEMPEAIYASRRGVQRALVLGFAGLGAVMLAGIAWRIRSAPRLALAIGAALSLVGYTSIRWVSLHAVDRVIGRYVLGIRVNTWIELVVLGAIALVALRPSRSRS